MVRDGLRPPHHEVTPHPAALAVSSADAVATARTTSSWDKEVRSSARALRRNSIEPAQSSGPRTEPDETRKGEDGDGRGTCFYRYRCLEAEASRFCPRAKRLPWSA